MKSVIREFILQGGDFEKMALALWRWQVDHNPEYGRFCNGFRPLRWQDIPAVPVGLFRDFPLTCFPPFAANHIFRSSGTTGKRGTHRLQDTDIYDLGSKTHMQKIIGGVPSHAISLVSPAFDSSLGHMCKLFSPIQKTMFVPEYGLYVKESWEALRTTQVPIFLPATSFAMAALLDTAKLPCQLPEGSVIMITGGFKGHKFSIGEADLIAKTKRIFPNTTIVGEYGMTELSSQLWSKTLGGPFIPPPWLKVLAVEPRSGQPCDGYGQLRFFDLANHQTVMAIETQDHGRVLDDGSVELLGRLPKAPIRGCSLQFEESMPSKNASENKLSSPTNQHQPFTLNIDRVRRCVAVLQRLNNRFETSWTPNLSSQNALWGLHHACKTLTSAALIQELQSHTLRPRNIAIVVAEGVFTAALEWIAMAISSGANVEIKAPAANPHFYQALASIFTEAGLPLHCHTSYQLNDPDTIIAFGTDENLDTIRDNHPDAHFTGYGHRFSVVVCEANPDLAENVANDITAYDSQGCMAPTGILLLGDPAPFVQRLDKALAAMAQTRPSGQISTYWGPEIRRRMAIHQLYQQLPSFMGKHVFLLPKHTFEPIALPRLASVYSYNSLDEIYATLQPWKDQLSSVAWSAPAHPLQNLFPRVCKPGELQTPAFPRLHDGRPMWRSFSP